MRILRKPVIPKGPAKWLVLGLLVIITFMTAFAVFPLTVGSVYRNWPLIVVMLLTWMWVRAWTSGQLPGLRPPRKPVRADRGPVRWTTASSMRNAHLFGALILIGFAGVILWKTPEIEARDIPADMLFVRVGLGTLLVLFVGLVIAAFRPPSGMALDDGALTLEGRDALRLPLSTIEEVVIRPRTDPFVAVLRFNDGSKDLALELGRLNLDPTMFADELTRRRPSIAFSDSRPGAFAGSSVLTGTSDGDPREIR